MLPAEVTTREERLHRPRIGEIQDSYFLTATDGGGPNNGLGVPLTDAQMKQQVSFANWDFENVWMISEGKDYPRLRWEKQ